MDAVTEVKSRLNIEDVVSEYVQLKRSGRNFKGLSPFTSEKTPSFIVSPEKQIWHDFSSGRGGDVISFIEIVEGLDFKAALELLARKAGVDLTEFQSKQGNQSSSKQNKERLYAAVESAVKFYQVQLTKHMAALSYVREKRGYEKQTLLDFRFGYAPAQGSELVKYLKKKGYTDQELKTTGLATMRRDGLSDMFRDRLMIPLLDQQGRPVGFTARLLKDDPSAPKYINTPATVLYDKGRQVFGLSQAKEAIRKSGYVVVVEGNLDVVASHQAGIKQVVASAGTALTTHHLKSLQRFTGDIRLAFDDDRAGQSAVERAIPLAQGLGLELGIITLPAGKDPDELVKKDPKAWIETTQQHVYMVDWLVERIARQVDMSTAQGKRQFASEVLGIVKELKDPVEKEHYIHVVASRTGSSVKTIQEKLDAMSMQHTQRRLKRVVETAKEIDQSAAEHIRYEQHVLAIAHHTPAVLDLVKKIPLDVFSDEIHDFVNYMQTHDGALPKESEYGKLVTLLFEEMYQHTDETELEYQGKQLVSRLVRSYAKTKKNELSTQLETADDHEQVLLLTAVKQLDALAKQFAVAAN